MAILAKPGAIPADEKEGFIEIILFLILASKMALQTFPFAYLMSYPSIIRPLAIFLATTFYLSKITSYCCRSTAQVRNIVC
jgi:hypothetical protein